MTTRTGNVIAEVELIYRSKVRASDRPKVKKSQEAYHLLLNHWDDNKIDFVEEMKLLLLNRANAVLGIMDVSSGCTTGTVADPRIILAAMNKTNSTGCILCHNHPSGNLKPSRADEELTAKIAAATKLIDVRVLDHLIITRKLISVLQMKASYNHNIP